MTSQRAGRAGLTERDLEEAVTAGAERARLLADTPGASPFLILERGPHFAQCAFEADGSVLAEIVSNNFLQGEAQLLPGSMEHLTGSGWHAPQSAPCKYEFCEMDHPNCWRFFLPPIDAAAIERTLVDAATSVFKAPLSAFMLHQRPTRQERDAVLAHARSRRISLK